MLDLEKFKSIKRLTDMDRYKLSEEIGLKQYDTDELSDAELIAKVEAARSAPTDTPLRLDIGCGKNKKEGFIGIDQFEIPGVDFLCDLRGSKTHYMPGSCAWGFSAVSEEKNALIPTASRFQTVENKGFMLVDNSVDEVHCSHFVEHLTADERVQFMNELYRVMKPGAKAMIITPHWASNRAYGDMTHCWPPVSEMWFYYLSKQWREDQVPHTDIRWNPKGYSCDFEASWGYSLHPALNGRNQEYTMHAQTFWKEAVQDMMAQLTKK